MLSRDDFAGVGVDVYAAPIPQWLHGEEAADGLHHPLTGRRDDGRVESVVQVTFDPNLL